MIEDELQNRTCRCCNRTFKYPVPKSTATRFYCARCADLDRAVRDMFELFNKRLRRLDAALASSGKTGPASGERP